MMIIATSIGIVTYTSLITYLFLGIRKYKPAQLQDNLKPKFSFSIIIPCKNEEKRLASLLKSIHQLDYSHKHFELIFIDDQSDDSTYKLLSEFKNENDQLDIKLLINESSRGKKSAIQLGINQSNYDYIITTDADCFLPKGWLAGFNQHLSVKRSAMIIAPVVYSHTNTFLDRFQHDDFLSLQAVTIATAQHQKPILCNGANLCYEKRVFYEVNGFKSHQDVASGDDILLMESFLKYKHSVDYINVRVTPVITKPMLTWKALINQRRRWASKVKLTNSPINSLLIIVISAFSLVAFTLLIASFFDSSHFSLLFMLISAKWILDYLLFSALAKKITIIVCIRKLMLSSLVYPVWLIVLAFALIKKSFIWKGRKYQI